MNMIVADGVSFQYEYPDEPPLKVLEHIDLTIEQGSFVALLGHNGCGKSTIAKHFNAMLLPTGGTVLVKEMNTSDEALKYEVRRTVGMVLQNPDNQLVSTIVEEDVAFGPENMGLSEEEIDKRVRQAAAFVGLREELLEKSPFELSGGEKRRAAIAGVMAMEPEVLILDEPTAGLDPKGRDTILEQIRAYQEQRGTTVLLVSHSMEDIARVAKRVLVMNRGEVAMYAPTEEVFSRAAELEAIGLSIPAVTRVFMRLRDKGLPVGDNVYTVEQAAARLLPLLKGGDTPC